MLPLGDLPLWNWPPNPTNYIVLVRLLSWLLTEKLVAIVFMSSISKAPSTNDISTESLEESGWTKYFEEFFNNQNENQNCSISLSAVAGSPNSLVSDAASLAPKKLADNEKPEDFPMKKNVKRSSLKNRKNIVTALVDEALEDTASSPLSSSKVLYGNHFVEQKQTEEVELSDQEKKGSTSGQRDEQKELDFNGRDSGCTEVKKRGLRLLPLSMVVNYLG